IVAALSQCPACNSTLVRPHTLPCGYTVCHQCDPINKPCVSSSCQRTHTTQTNTNVTIDQIHDVLRSWDKSQLITEDLLRMHLVSLLECAICYSCFYQPATAPCGHTFCHSCLVRSLDHMPSCPICRQPIGWTPPPTPLLCQLVSTLFSQEPETQHEHDDSKRVPILIGALAFPHVRCVIHIFEPRYRLMLRRVMESRRRRFAMCMPVRRSNATFNEYGTMLELTHVQTLEDGRSVVQAVGSHRFRVVKHEMLDGYHVGELERVDDIDGEQEQALEREEIMRACAQRAQQEQAKKATLDRSATQASPQPARPRPVTGFGGMFPHQRQSWAAQAHPQTQVARSPWLQMHLHGLSAAQTKQAAPHQRPVPRPSQQPQQAATVNRHEQTTDDLIKQLASFVTLLRGTTPSSSQTPDRFAQWLRALGEPPAITGPRRNRNIFTWWVANMMPLNQEEKAKLLAMRLLRERVLMLIKWVDRFKDQWSYWLRCNGTDSAA
ncbi:PUA-like domain-containing protein, partial [Fennellomyces sp. T-0311]